MSLFNFPPLDNPETSYCIQELNGRLVYGLRDDVDLASKTELLRNYPVLDKDRLDCLEYALSRDNVRRVFSDVRSNKLTQAYDIWQSDGAKGIWNYVEHMSEGNRFAWPIAKIGNAIRQVEERFRKVIATSEEDVQDFIAKSTDVLEWRSNWIRCIACSYDGERLAVCQANDHIRIYLCDSLHKAPITLKHSFQKDVANMAWKPFDQFALAVACNTVIIVWRFAQQKLANRVSPQCAQVLELPSVFCPATQCIWDKSLSATLFVASPSSSQILIMDTLTGDSQLIGSWFGSCIRRLFVSPDGSSILVTYRSNVIKVYDRNTWKSESWSKLKGNCVSAVWAPDSSFFFFACEDETLIRVIRFITRDEVSADGERLQQRYGTSETLVIYEVEEVEQELVEGCVSYSFGGIIREMQLSSDGQRLAVSFKRNCSVIALFIVDDKPKIRLTPCGLVDGQLLGNASLMRFIPKFPYGSLLAVAWSAGTMQYIPLLYGPGAETISRTVRFFLSSFEPGRKSNIHDSLPDELSSTSVEPNTAPSYDVQPSDETENEVPELFSSAGLYDRLVAKSLIGNKGY